MERIIGIDYGVKRVGIAISDPLCIFASPLETIQTTKIIDYLKNYAYSEGIKMFVVGYPKKLNNAISETTKRVDNFIAMLKRAFPYTPILTEDERLTTIIAQKALIDGGMKKSDRAQKGSADKVSAALILQSYLDRVNR